MRESWFTMTGCWLIIWLGWFIICWGGGEIIWGGWDITWGGWEIIYREFRGWRTICWITLCYYGALNKVCCAVWTGLTVWTWLWMNLCWMAFCGGICWTGTCWTGTCWIGIWGGRICWMICPWTGCGGWVKTGPVGCRLLLWYSTGLTVFPPTIDGLCWTKPPFTTVVCWGGTTILVTLLLWDCKLFWLKLSSLPVNKLLEMLSIPTLWIHCRFLGMRPPLYWLA